MTFLQITSALLETKFIATFSLMYCLLLCLDNHFLDFFFMKDLAVSYCGVLLSSAHMTVHLAGSRGMPHDPLLLEADTQLALVLTDTLLCPIGTQA